MDIAKCEGIACEIKQSCLRFTMEIPTGDREWWYTQGRYADGKCNIYIPNGKPQCLTSSPPSSLQSPISHGDYGILVANGNIPMTQMRLFSGRCFHWRSRFGQLYIQLVLRNAYRYRIRPNRLLPWISEFSEYGEHQNSDHPKSCADSNTGDFSRERNSRSAENLGAVQKRHSCNGAKRWYFSTTRGKDVYANANF